jgi:hypothetical protein
MRRRYKVQIVEKESMEQSAERGKPTKTVTVSVNNRSVTFEDNKATGMKIKETAISQGVPIQADFALFEEKGGNLKPVGDSETVTLHPNQRFRAVAPDDNS